MSRARSRSLVGVLVAGVLLAAGSVASASDPNSNNNNSAKLRRAVTVEGIMEHQEALAAISDESGGANRLAGAPGYEDSADYAADRARAAGYDVSFHEFHYELLFLADWEAPVLSVGGDEFVAGIAGASLGGDFGSMFKSTPYGIDVTAPVFAVDLALPPVGPPNTSTSGCEAADYAGMPAGAIIIVQRGTCTFAQKFTLADASPAAAMVSSTRASRVARSRCGSTSTASRSRRSRRRSRPARHSPTASTAASRASRPGSRSTGARAPTPRATSSPSRATAIPTT